MLLVHTTNGVHMMRKRLAVISAGILAGLMALGTANALVLDTTSGSTATEQAVAGLETTYEVGDAGTVTVSNDGTVLEIVSVVQATGWQIEIEVASGREVEVDFTSGTRRIQFNAELEDGQIRVRAREETVAATTTTQSTTESKTAAAVANTTDNGTTVYEAGDAGKVTISNDGTTLTITVVDPADGWSHEIEVMSGREVEVDFRKGGERVQFNAELEDGEVRVRVRTRSDDNGRTETTSGIKGDSVSDDNDSSDHDDNDSDDDDSDDGVGDQGQKGSDSDDSASSADDDHGDRGRGGSDHDDDRSDD
jgi:hypothetical protein